MKISEIKKETLKTLYENYSIEKRSVKAGTKVDYNPLLGKNCVEMPSLEQYKYASGKLDGFLMALQWNIEEKDDKVIVRRYSDNRKLFTFTAFA